MAARREVARGGTGTGPGEKPLRVEHNRDHPIMIIPRGGVRRAAGAGEKNAERRAANRRENSRAHFPLSPSESFGHPSWMRKRSNGTGLSPQVHAFLESSSVVFIQASRIEMAGLLVRVDFFVERKKNTLQKESKKGEKKVALPLLNSIKSQDEKYKLDLNYSAEDLRPRLSGN